MSVLQLQDLVGSEKLYTQEMVFGAIAELQNRGSELENAAQIKQRITERDVKRPARLERNIFFQKGIPVTIVLSASLIFLNALIFIWMISFGITIGEVTYSFSGSFYVVRIIYLLFLGFLIMSGRISAKWVLIATFTVSLMAKIATIYFGVDFLILNIIRIISQLIAVLLLFFPESLKWYKA